MADLKSISLPHGTIPTQMFGNVNLQNAMTYVNENFAAVKDGVNEAVSAANAAISEKADADHNHDSDYSKVDHTHSQSEVVGLQSALDGKADLNHEHSQYLSSLPAHYHATSEVQGLGEMLQQKAESVHTHSIADVDGLGTELGTKASTAYVDQQTTQLGESIKTIADVEVLNYKSDAGSADREGDVPQDVVSAPQDETTAQKNARVGSAQRWARADHKHVFSAAVGTAQKIGGNAPYPDDWVEVPADATLPWTAGGENGAEICILYRSVSDSVSDQLVACKLTISNVGTITKIERIGSGSTDNTGIYVQHN